MFLFFSKLLPPFLFPPGLQIVLIAISFALFGRRPRIALAMAALALGSLYLFSTRAVAGFVMGSVESVYPAISPADAPRADAIVVLGDFLNAPTRERRAFSLIDESDRLRNGGLLYRAGKAPFVLLTGGAVSVYGQTTEPQAVVAKNLLSEWGIPPDSIGVEAQSQNTFENAAFSKPILQQHGARKILLVTSAFHLPRSTAIFRRAGFEVIPFPCDYRMGWYQPVFPLSLVPEAKYLFFNSLAIHEWLGIAVYKIRGWA